MGETLFPLRQGADARWVVQHVAANSKSMRFVVRRTVVAKAADGRAKRLHDLGVPARYARSRPIAAMLADALNSAERRDENEATNEDAPGSA